MKKYCLNCGKLLTEEQVKYGGKFCSHSCSASYNNKHMTKEHSGPISKVYQISDEEFIDIINNSYTLREIYQKLGYSKNSGKSKRHLVDKRCKELNLTLKYQTFDAPSKKTKKELFEGRSSWQSARTEFRRQASKSFEESGKEKKCAVCGYDKHIDIAHIKAVSEFSEDTLVSEISKASNLIALCPNHHWEYDHGLLDITPYI